MAIVAALGGGLFMLASLIVGGRLVLLSYKTRGLPEFLLGLGLFCMGGVGYPLIILATRVEGFSDRARCTMLVANMLTSLVGMSALAWFTRRVFRPQAAWAGFFVLFTISGFAALALLQAFGPGLASFIEDPKTGPWSMKIFMGLFPMSWAGFESIRYYRMQHRRLLLGLADPIVTDRFRLWGISILAADTITILGVAFNLMGVPMTSTPIGSLWVGILGLVTAGGLWLAFVPPQFYLDRVSAGRAQPTTAAGQ